MKITLDKIKQLRKETKVGVLEVRQALQASKGDGKKAKQWLLEKGLVKASKKTGRATGEGLIETYVHINGKVGAIVKLACETDFVAKTKEFRVLAHEIAMQVTSMNPKDIDQLLSQEYIRDKSKKVGDLIKGAIAKLGENIKIIEFKLFKI